MKIFLIFLIFLVSCTKLDNKNNYVKDIDISQNLTFNEFKTLMIEYGKNNLYRNISE